MSDALDYVEALVSRLPVVVRRRVRWAECDPAGVVFTGRFFDYVAAAFAWFQRELVDQTGFSLASVGIGTPIRSVNLEFLAMLRPDDWFEMRVLVKAVRIHTFELEICATKGAGEPVFVAQLTPIGVDNDTKRKIPLPQEVKDWLRIYASKVAGRAGSF